MEFGKPAIDLLIDVAVLSKNWSLPQAADHDLYWVFLYNSFDIHGVEKIQQTPLNPKILSQMTSRSESVLGRH